jgi:hypothetical protein
MVKELRVKFIGIYRTYEGQQNYKILNDMEEED